MRRIILFTILFAFFILPVLAQKPKSLTYHFVARDEAGQLLAGKKLQLIIFLSEDSPDKTAIYQESHIVQSGKEGNVSITIGDGISSQNFSDLIIDPRNEYYLTLIGVNPADNRELFEQKVQVLILPVGIYAGTIDNLADSYFFESPRKELQALFLEDGRLFLSNGAFVEMPDYLTTCNSIMISVDKMNVSCFGQKDGAIDVKVVGGTPPYTYSWSNGATSADIADLEAGEYELYVTDAVGFTAVKKVEIEQPDPLKIQAIINNVSSIGKSDGSISLKLEGGNPNSKFFWSNGSRSRTLRNLAPGFYQVTVTSGQNCMVTKQFSVKEPLNVKFTTKNVFCHGGNDGAIQARIKGGLPPYEINWSNQLEGDYINKLSAGNYGVTIKDSWGYVHRDTVQINEPDQINVNADITNVKEGTEKTGKIDIEVSGGTPPYKYHWSNSSTLQDVDQLDDGVYSVVITDNRYCRMKQDNIIVYREFTDDRDGQIYRAIEIGDQIWMAENVNFGKYIESAKQPTRVGAIEKYCYNDEENNCKSLGGLYSWDEMMDYKRSDDGEVGGVQGVCPDGWHIPTDKEWQQLATYLGGDLSIGNKMKNFLYWTIPLQDGSLTTTGFSALPAGRMDNTGTYYYIGNSTSFWSATKADGDKAWHRTLTDRSAALYRGSSHISLRFSVRCVKDPD